MYDVVFITNVPAFYKINLYRALMARQSIFVIFLGTESEIRTADFNNLACPFPHVFLSEGPYEQRSILSSVFKLKRILGELAYHKVVLGGWDLPEYWLARTIVPTGKLVMSLESGIGESDTRGLRATLKRYFLKKMDTVLASGLAHKALLTALGYRGKTCITRGVGLINRLSILPRGGNFEGRYLYLGRLSPEKNLVRLLEVFRELPQFTLSIVGNGEQLEELKAIASDNVHFESHIPNEYLNELFRQHDVLILPSLKEPWGVVVEEALYHGLPVLVSSRAGIAEWIEQYQCGLLLDPDSTENIKTQILACADNYKVLKNKVERIDFEQEKNYQLLVYREGLQ